MLSQLPSIQPGELEAWLVPAAAVMSIALLARQLFMRRAPIEAEFLSKAEFEPFRSGVERDLDSLRDRLDARFLSLGEKIELLKIELLKDGERRAESLHHRINELESGLARVDERTKS
jgi:hypothetical protein